MSVAHVLAYPLITPKQGFIEDFSSGGGGGAPIIRGMGMKGGCAPPVQSVEAITHSKLRKCLLTVKLSAKQVLFTVDFVYSYCQFCVCLGGGGGVKIPNPLSPL